MKKYLVTGICFVPHEVEMTVVAHDPEEAVRVALLRRWQNFIQLNSADTGAAFDWVPSAEEIQTQDKQ